MADTPASNQPSTLQSTIDAAKGTVQKGLGALTGNTADQSAGEQQKQAASAEHDASQASAKAGPFTLSTSGAVAKDDPNRTTGSWNQTVGSGKEMLGNMVGSEQLKSEGAKQNQQGKEEEAQGQLKDLGGGIAGRAKGYAGGVAAAMTGDRAEQERMQQMHDEGKARQRGVEHDLQKKVDAENAGAQ